MKEVEILTETIEALRIQIIDSTAMTYDLACTVSTSAKAKEQMERTSEAWNLFLTQWQELKDKIKKDEEFEKRTIDKGNELSKLARIVKKI